MIFEISQSYFGGSNFFLVTNNFDCSGQEVLILELTQLLIIHQKNVDKLRGFLHLYFHFLCFPGSLI